MKAFCLLVHSVSWLRTLCGITRYLTLGLNIVNRSMFCWEIQEHCYLVKFTLILKESSIPPSLFTSCIIWGEWGCKARCKAITINTLLHLRVRHILICLFHIPHYASSEECQMNMDMYRTPPWRLYLDRCNVPRQRTSTRPNQYVLERVWSFSGADMTCLQNKAGASGTPLGPLTSPRTHPARPTHTLIAGANTAERTRRF